jgi:YesN/AraC family two-component response regulator
MSIMLQVLIVEDNASYREWLHQLLAERFPLLRIAEAADGEDALRQALSLCFGLIFMDIRLPHANGLDLTKTIKRAFPTSVICVMSSYAMLEYREAAFRNGADHFAVKSDWTEAQFVNVVESLLRAPQSS